jgi:hypothetical protein
MPFFRRTFALPGALLLTLVGAASAQATPGLEITAPANGAYVNDTTPTISYTGASGLTTVTLNVNGVPGPSVPVATGSITSAAVADTVVFSVDDDDTAERSADVTVHVDQVPSLSGTGDGSTVDPGDVRFDASTAIPATTSSCATPTTTRCSRACRPMAPVGRWT